MRWLVDARPLADAGCGGVGRVARCLTDALIRIASDDEIVLATTGSTSATDALPTGPNVHHIHLRVPNKLWSAACMTRLASFDSTITATAYRLPPTASPPFDATFLPNLGFVGRMTRPYILLLHDLSFLIEPRWFRPKARLWHRAVDATSQIRNATHLLAVSETTKRDAMRLLDIPSDRITVIPLGPTFNLPPVIPAKAGIQNPTDKLPSEKRYVLCLGAGDPRKNAATAVAAVAALRREAGFEDLELILVGTRYPVLGTRYAPWIRSLAHPTDLDLADLYRHASAFLYPSWYEGYGLPLHEAAAFGTPCIASTAGALPETAPPGTLFADPAKPHHWTEALKLLLSSATRYPVPDTSNPRYTAQPWDESARILLAALRTVTH
ncbi:glycosyltransferase family 4 protein [Candidatus Uhrbacteria bacterium]|nr:glycosyltransferase family 4 protein [Candidatus Uhrbacteria bacterium]